MKFWSGVIVLFLIFVGYGREAPPVLFYNLKQEETNVRFGPSNQFPVKFYLKCRRLPVEIKQANEEWYKLQDSEGEEGWVHKRMVFPGAIVLVTKKIPLTKEKKTSSAVLAHLSKGVLVKLKECHNQLCRVELKIGKKSLTGWVPEKNLWGISAPLP